MSSDSPRAEPAASLRPSPAAAIGATLSISAVARQTGVSVATLRVWQARYGLGPGLTIPGGHRRYTTGDVQRLRRVKRLVSEGLTTSEAVHAVLAAARSDLGLQPDADPVAHHLGAAALELDGPTARRLVDEHLRRGDVTRTWETVLRPVLGAIGERWSNLSYGIAVEHLLSHIACEALCRHNDEFRTEITPTTQAILLACAPGELHDLPLVALDAALRADALSATRYPGFHSPGDARRGRSPASTAGDRPVRHGPTACGSRSLRALPRRRRAARARTGMVPRSAPRRRRPPQHAGCGQGAHRGRRQRPSHRAFPVIIGRLRV
jgi:DNA-binding transcriptional MerR regulator